MSIKVLLKEYPHRSIALVTSSHALVFQHSPSSNTENSSINGYLTGSNASYASLAEKYGNAPRIMVEFSNLSAIDLQDYRPLTHPCKGTLGLVTLGKDVFICLVNGSSHVATVRPGERVERIHTVEFHCLNRSEYDRMLEREVNSYNTTYLDEDGFDYGGGQPIMEHPCLAIKKLLSGGTFYYSTDFDLTNRLQNRSIESHTFDIDNFDPSFLWNSYMIAPLLKFRSHLSNSERRALDESHLLTSAIRGFVETLTIPHHSSFSSSKKVGVPASLTLISRLSCKRAGTRFNARGIDDEGNVANFVETEVVIWDPAGGAAGAGLGFSYCQVRGSVPIFWEQQTGLLPTQQKITLSRSPEATQPAFDKHFEGLTLKYGVTHVVNLLSATKPGEIDLSKRFRYHIRNSPLNHDPGYQTEKFSTGQGVKGAGGHGVGTLIRATEYDFHAETQGRYENAHAIRRLLEQSAEGFAYFIMEELGAQSSSKRPNSETAVVLLQQEGVFRTNCLDCLDRTNLVQGILSQLAIESFLYYRQDDVAPDFWMRHSTLWADNGDALSKIYAGTGALKSSFTRHGKSSWGGLIADARKSATRMYINKFMDTGRQETIDVLLGRQLGIEPVQLYDPINDYAQAELLRRAPEYSSTQKIQILVGTFNVNGHTNGLNNDLSSWLCPDLMNQQPELVVVGFQEIVELSPQQIMSTDPARRQLWEKAVLNCLNMNAVQRGGEEYILLRSGQLVGAALMIFVKSSAIGNIKNVEGSLKKTGMSGVAGNKGAVAIRLDYASTRLCFVTAHLAAGFSNYEERNRDYRTIAHGLRFQRGRKIDDHDSIIWLGDFNYRIELENERVKKLIEMGDLQTLYDNDQLNLQMMAGLTFPYYSEATLTFDPTYKFDVGKDIYDTSEKARIPAWCDRVLRKGANLKQLSYNSAPLRFSDHRPVYATFQCTVTYIDEAVKDKLSRQIYFKRRSEMGGTNGKISMPAMVNKEEEEDLLMLDDESGSMPGLPPPSSDSRKWWLDNGQLARSSVKPPGPDYIFNPNKSSNPFNTSSEPDWVKVDLTGASIASSITNTRNGYPAPPKQSVSPTPSVQSLNSKTASTLTSTSPNLNNQVQRKRLPPPYDPTTLPALPTRANTLNNPGIGATKSAPPSIAELPANPVKRKVIAPPSIAELPANPVKRKVIAPPPTNYPQPTENASSSLPRKPLPLPPPPLTTSSSVSQIQSQLQQLSVTINSPIPPTPESATSASAKKPLVPKKPSVLTKPPPSTTRTPSPPPQPPRPTPPPASSSQPNRLSKPPPPQPMNFTSSSTAQPPPASKSIKSEPEPLPARLKKLPSTAKLPAASTSQSAPQSPITPIPPVPPPPPPVRRSVVAGAPPAEKFASPSTTGAGIPVPLPVRAMTLATDMVGGDCVAVGGVNVGVDSENQITDVRKGVAKWESLG